jgi:hypothetical protein
MIMNEQMLRSVCDCEGNCMLWRLGTNDAGYPMARVDGKPRNMRRYVYQKHMGMTIRPGSVVAARCGQKLCLSPECLIQRTRSQVTSKSYSNGNRDTPAEYLRRQRAAVSQGKAKLDQAKANEIRVAFSAGERALDIAARYGVSRHAVNDIVANKTWRRSAKTPRSVFELAEALCPAGAP